jgi:hypothetical protein
MRLRALWSPAKSPVRHTFIAIAILLINVSLASARSMGVSFFSLLEDRKAHGREPVALPPATRGNATCLRSTSITNQHEIAFGGPRRARTEEQRKQFLSLAEEWREAALLIENTSVPSKLSQP